MPRHKMPQMTNCPPTPAPTTVSLSSGNWVTRGGLVIDYENSTNFQYDVLHARIDNPEMTRKEAEEYCLALHKLTGETNEDD